MGIYRLDSLKLGIFDDPASLRKKVEKEAARRAGLSRGSVSAGDLVIRRQSLDARDKTNIKWVYTVDFSCNKELALPLGGSVIYDQMTAKKMPDERPVVVGFGPCGMFCALILAAGGLRPIVLERGKKIAERIKDVERYWQSGELDESSNVQFGEGGAGTFSDGKLTTGIKDPRIAKVLAEFVAAGAPAEIMYKQKPHIGTDVLRRIIPNIREKIESLGGEIRFSTTVSGIIKDPLTNSVRGVITKDGERINSRDVIFAVGHSARDTFTMLDGEGLEMTPKAFSIGVRVEHPQTVIDRAQYGKRYQEVREIAGPAEYKLNCRASDGRGVYTFCMCPGGKVVMSASEKDTIVTNGMSDAKRDGLLANSALLVDVRPDDYYRQSVLDGADFQRKYEKLAFVMGKGKAPRSEYPILSGSPLARSLPDWTCPDIMEAMPVFGRKLKGFDDPENGIIFTGVETRSSSPVRMNRNEKGESNISGLYPAGEGAGYAGGITSSAVDGIRTAEWILSKYVDDDA